MTRLQPAYVADVAEAIGRIMQRTEAPPIFEFGGRCVYAYEEFLRAVARQAGVAPLLVAISFALLARTRMGLRNAPWSASHSQSSGTDADRHRVVAGVARIF